MAILPVVLFHAGCPAFQGGFVGVDVFFVISGYLITSLIRSERAAGHFTLTGFFLRRARRLLPALFVVMLVCTPVAWLLMLPDEFKSFGQSLVATTLLSNNILLWRTSGYFSFANEFKPLFHTWSLGVEEQFYLLFPLVLGGAARLGRNSMMLALAGIAISSLAFAYWLSLADWDGAYLLLPSRAWELMIGAIVAVGSEQGRELATSRVVNELVCAMGTALIFGPVFLLKLDVTALQLWLLVPTVGTALIIVGARSGTFAKGVLSHRAAVGVGLASYSIYLWHQPLFAFLRLRSLEPPAAWQVTAAIGATLCLAALSWRYVERPFRSNEVVPQRAFLIFGAAAALGLVGAGLIVHRETGMLQLWPAEVVAAGRDVNAEYVEEPRRLSGIPFDTAKGGNVLVLGNSFARDFINAGLANGYFRTSSVSYSEHVPSCLVSLTDMEQSLRERLAAADYIVIASSAPHVECWRSDFALMRAIGARRIVVIGPKGFGWNNNALMWLPRDERLKYRARVRPEILELNDRLARELPAEHFVDVLAMLSDQDGRVPVFTPEGHFISPDRRHLTREGARFVGQKLFAHPLLEGLR